MSGNEEEFDSGRFPSRATYGQPMAGRRRPILAQRRHQPLPGYRDVRYTEPAPSDEPPKPTPSETLHQKHWWKTRDEGWVRVSEMSPSHALFSAAMLLRQASGRHWNEGLSMVSAAGMMQGEMALDSVDAIIEEHGEMSPVEWMRAQPLWKALVKQGRKGLG